MVEHAVSRGSGGGEKSPMKLDSNFDRSQLPLMKMKAVSYPYPPPLTTYEEIAGSRETFMDTIKKLHAAMGSKFMIPVVGGKDLDLYKLFVEVTSRGGINKVMTDRKWKELAAIFNFPSSTTNASFILHKYYVSLLYHYDFKAKYWTPLTIDIDKDLIDIGIEDGISHICRKRKQTDEYFYCAQYTSQNLGTSSINGSKSHRRSKDVTRPPMERNQVDVEVQYLSGVTSSKNGHKSHGQPKGSEPLDPTVLDLICNSPDGEEPPVQE